MVEVAHTPSDALDITNAANPYRMGHEVRRSCEWVMNRLNVSLTSFELETVATHYFYNQQNPHEFLVLEVVHANFSSLC
jgi:hypothetical protein